MQPSDARVSRLPNAAVPLAMSSRDHLFKVLVVGDAAVGKTSLVQRYSQDSFSRHYKSTVGGEPGRGRGGGPRAPTGLRAPLGGSGDLLPSGASSGREEVSGSWRE